MRHLKMFIIIDSIWHRPNPRQKCKENVMTEKCLFVEMHSVRCSSCTPDSTVHGANKGPTWVLSAPDGPHVGPMNIAIWGSLDVNCIQILKL